MLADWWKKNRQNRSREEGRMKGREEGKYFAEARQTGVNAYPVYAFIPIYRKPTGVLTLPNSY